MDLSTSVAVKAITKRSKQMCIMYLILCVVFGILFIGMGVDKCLTEFSFANVMVVVIGLGGICGAYVFTKMLVTNSYRNGIQDYFTARPDITIAGLDQDFAETNHIVKSLWIGNKYTYHVGYLYPYIIENADLIWVYLTRISGKGGGWSINFCDKNKKMTSVTIKSEKKAKQIVETYQNKFSHIVIGYSEQLETMYNRDLDSFLKIKYQQNV